MIVLKEYDPKILKDINEKDFAERVNTLRNCISLIGIFVEKEEDLGTKTINCPKCKSTKVSFGNGNETFFCHGCNSSGDWLNAYCLGKNMSQADGYNEVVSLLRNLGDFKHLEPYQP